jgi:hypothetical protein
MYIQPDIGRLLARAKVEEAESRLPPASLLRAALLERRRRAVTIRPITGPYRRATPILAPTRK